MSTVRTVAELRSALALLRRVTFDLTGLPPQPEDVAAFLADTSPTARAPAPISTASAW